MRSLKLTTISILGFFLISWVYLTFIIKEHHVHISKNQNNELVYLVDDGNSYKSPRECVQHCLQRTEKNLRHTIEITATKEVQTNEIQYLADLMTFNQIYLTSWRFMGEKKVKYSSGEYYQKFDSNDRITNNNPNKTSEPTSLPAGDEPKPQSEDGSS